MGFLYSQKAQEGMRKQKLNSYNLWILFLLAPTSITYGYSGSIIGTTLGLQAHFAASLDCAYQSE